MRFCKPFVEKPIDGDDHSIMIYYPSSTRGGMKELFRKVGNRSSEFHPEVRKVRHEGSYIYIYIYMKSSCRLMGQMSRFTRLDLTMLMLKQENPLLLMALL
uniref:Uncharacterized protein n=1 Tax=Opuntia streptacantha TaxID=393608 RepID=A0A7C8YW07_OPUST